MKKPSFVVAALTMIALNAPTYAMPQRPAKCPAVANIKFAGLSYATSGDEGYTVAQFNNYSTNDKWLFGFTSIQAKSSQEALTIGRQLLGTLYGTPQPVAITSENIWGCLYETSQGYYGVALTPISLSATINQTMMAAIH